MNPPGAVRRCPHIGNPLVTLDSPPICSPLTRKSLRRYKGAQFIVALELHQPKNYQEDMSMKKLFIAIVLVVAIPLNLFAQEQANKPDYKDGDFWQYKVTEKGFRQQSTTALNGVYELTYRPDRIAIRLEGGEQREIRQAVGQRRRMVAIDDVRERLQVP